MKKTSYRILRLTSVALLICWIQFVAQPQRRRQNQRPTPQLPSTEQNRRTLIDAPITDELWANIYGADVFNVESDVRDSNTLYATTYRGLYRSTNSGLHWQLLFSPPNSAWLTFAQSQSSPNVFYVGTSWDSRSFEGALWKTSDNGSTWSNVSAGTITKAVRSIRIDPSTPDAVYVFAGQLHKSLNGGKSWAVIGSGPNVSIDPSNPQHVLSLLAESWDGGLTWRRKDVLALYPRGKKLQFPDGEQWSWLFFHPFQRNRLFGFVRKSLSGGQFPDTFVMSEDDGETWKDISVRERGTVDQSKFATVNSLEFSKTKANTIYAGTNQGLFVSDDGGANWAKILDHETKAITLLGDALYAVRQNGIWRSPNGGKAWHQASLGLPKSVSDNTERPSLALIDGSTSKIYVTRRGGYETSTDGGITWKWNYVVPGYIIYQIFLADDKSVFLNNSFLADGVDIEGYVMGTATSIDSKKSVRGPLLRVADNGTVSRVDAPVRANRVAVSSDLKVMYLTNSNDVFKSEDAGFSWRKIHEFSSKENLDLRASQKSAEVLYAFALRNNYPFFSSVDGGQSWRDSQYSFERAARSNPNAFTPGIDDGIFDVVSINPDPQSVKTVWIATRMSLYKSVDAGLTWNKQIPNKLLGTITTLGVNNSSPTVMYVGSDVGVWKSVDSGRRWRLISRGLNGDVVISIVATDKLVIAQGLHGIYRLSDERLSWALERWNTIDATSSETALGPSLVLKPLLKPEEAMSPKESVGASELEKGLQLYRDGNYDESFEHLNKALEQGEELRLRIKHRHAGPSLGLDDDFCAGELTFSAHALTFRSTTNYLEAGKVGTGGHDFSVPLKQIYEFKAQPNKGGRLHLKIGIRKGTKEDKKDYDLYSAAAVLNHTGDDRRSCCWKIECSNCLGHAQLLANLLERLVAGIPSARVDPFAAAVSAAPSGLANGEWSGEWNDNSHNMFIFEMRIVQDSGDKISGSITWTLKKTEDQRLQAKIGLTAVEYITGRYDGRKRELSFRGYKKDDPNDVIGLDKYRLLLSTDGRTLSGTTETGGTWEGKLSAMKVR